jgi:hypothetical protein
MFKHPAAVTTYVPANVGLGRDDFVGVGVGVATGVFDPLEQATDTTRRIPSGIAARTRTITAKPS